MSAGWVARAYATAATNRLTLGYTLATGAIFSTLMGYINSAQQIFVDVYRLGAWFPVVFGGVALGVALASFVNGRMVERLGMRWISHWALIGFVATGLVQLGDRQPRRHAAARRSSCCCSRSRCSASA